MAASMDVIIQNYFAANSEEAAKQLATDLNKSNTKFLKFIELLESYLTNTDNVTRGRATQMIGDVLNLLPVAFLTSEQAEVVARFLLAKLSDTHSVQPHALKSLAVLTNRCKSLSNGLPEDICRTIFREIQNQTLSHSDRRSTYWIIQNLLGSSNQAIEQMGGDFIIGFIQQMDAEKDPRNLLICFNIAHFISSYMRLGPYTEEMFEVLGCYFPIDFVPPPNDPNGITKEQLVTGLRRCLAATSDFAEYCLPLFLEKMTSDLQEARKDAMLTLAVCAPVYGSHLMAYLGSLTSTFKREILMNISSELVNAARDAIKAVYSAVTPDEGIDNSKNDAMASSIVELYQDTAKYLDGTDIKKSCLGFSMFRSVAASSPTAFCIVVPLVLPSLIKHCSEPCQITEQLLYMKELKEFLSLIKQFNTHKGAMQVIKDNLSALLNLYEERLNNSDNVDIQLEALEALAILTAPSLCDTLDKTESFVKTLMEKSLVITDPVFRQSVLSALHNIVQVNANLVPNIIEWLIEKSHTNALKSVAEIMIHVVTDMNQFQIVNHFLLQKLSQFLIDGVSVGVECIQSLAQLLVQMHSNKSCVDIFVHTTVTQILRTAVSAVLQWTEESRDKCAMFLTAVRDIFRITSQHLNKSDVVILWEKLTKLMLESDTANIGIAGDFLTLKPLQSDSPWQQTRLIAILEGFLTGGDIQAMVDHRERIFESLYILTQGADDDFTRTSACKCVAVIFNKAPIGGEIHWLLEPMLDRLKMAMSPDRPYVNRQWALNTWVWLTKASECRGHSATATLSSNLFTLLEDNELGRDVALSLSLVVQDMNDLFSPSLHSNVTPLYKQRFFSLNIKSLLDGYQRNRSTGRNQNYLLAISNITSNLPLQILKPHLAKLVPILLLCLKEEDSSLHNTLILLSNAIVSVPDVIATSVDELVNYLLDLVETNNSMKVRITALQCLENLTTLPVHTITPLQPKVVSGLSISLDDKKRLVRKQAVSARCAWILLEKNKKC